MDSLLLILILLGYFLFFHLSAILAKSLIVHQSKYAFVIPRIPLD